MTDTNTQKRQIFLDLLQDNFSVYIHLDPRHRGVIVPTQFLKQPQLVLQVGLNMPVPIPDLEDQEAGICCTLSFSGKPHYCFIPYEAIWALLNDERTSPSKVWEDDVPDEVRTQAQKQKHQDEVKTLKVVHSNPFSTDRTQQTKPRPTHLRLVK